MATRIHLDDTRPEGPATREAEVLGPFFAGIGVPCPVGCGGGSELVRIGTRPDGGGEIWFECGSCAQRRRYDVPPASAAERAAVGAELAADREPRCPRHSTRELLKRRGRRLLCARCGVVFRD